MVSKQEALPAFTKLSQLFESCHDFSDSQLVLTDKDKEHVTIWDVINQKEEVEHVAKSIRRKLYEGHRYKDILVLLGDADAYKLQIGKILISMKFPIILAKRSP